MRWTLYKGYMPLLRYEKGQYIAAGIKTYNVMNIDSNYTSSKIRLIIQQAQKQEHGAMLIFFKHASDAQAETTRLVDYERGIKLASPIDLSSNKEFILHMTAIDGALFLDTDGICYGFGIIVDGRASISGTPVRGARFNSARTYVYFLKKIDCFACVISEDRTVDYICKEKKRYVVVKKNYNSQ